MKNIPQANRTSGFEISTGQTKNSLAAGDTYSYDGLILQLHQLVKLLHP